MGVLLFGFLILLAASDYMSAGLAIAPGLLISYYIYWRDRHKPEPHTSLLIAFVVGMLSTYPAIKMEEYGINILNIVPSEDIWGTFLFSFFVIGLVEEGAKLWFLRVFIVPKKDFNEPMDGIVYSVMISMGFATLENILYVIFRDGGSSVAFMRMFTAVPAHAAFAVMMGYFVGLSRFATTKRKSVLYFLLALLLPMTAHGLYDFFIFQKVSHYLVIVTFATLILSLLMGFWLINHHQEHSLNSENTDKPA